MASSMESNALASSSLLGAHPPCPVNVPETQSIPPGANLFVPGGILFSYTIFSGRTVSSNSGPVRYPRASTASFRVVPS